ncbi:glycosyltransferase [Brevibacterium linens ATCC 9172]|nr:glycosyltransferase [Brevibacterium linens ATCC 9172]
MMIMLGSSQRHPLTPRIRRRFPHKGLLPEGRHYALTWGIAYEFGGMTTVVLDRSSAFARQDNRRVEILTLSPEMKTQDRDKELHTEKRIDRRVKIRNLWKDLTACPDRKLRRMVGTLDVEECAIDDAMPRVEDGWSEYRRTDAGVLLQVDRYHDRGHLLVIDRLDMGKRGKRSGRRITLFDRAQNVIGQWPTARAFYHAWLDVVFDEKPTYLISDSSFTGALIHDYRRDNVILCQVMHNPFLQNPRDHIHGELSRGKSEFLKHLDSFDLVTTLTDQQQVDMTNAGLSAGRLRTVSNLTDDLHGDPTAPRDRRCGAMIARLAEQKRVEDAVRAIGTAVSSDPGIRLDVYGDGTDRPMLERLVDDLGVERSVILHGHTPGAKQNFHTASFSLLTSRFEGQGLVILESMSAGCIPIAYDIAYGPGDIIEDGVNGFLVPPGDTEACAATILRTVAMSDGEVEKMRRAAIARAADFFERPIVQRWGEVLAEKTFDPIIKLDNPHATISSASVRDDSIVLDIQVPGIGDDIPESVFVSWSSRAGAFFGRVHATLEGHKVHATIPTSRLTTIPPGLVDISIDFVHGRSFNRARLASDNSAITNESESVSLYTTAHGNLSARIHAASGSPRRA